MCVNGWEKEREWFVCAYEHMLPRYTIYQQNVLITTYNEKSLCRILYSDLWRCVFLWECTNVLEEHPSVLKMEATCYSKYCKTSIRQHDVTSLKTVLFKLKLFSLDFICLLALILAPKCSPLLMLYYFSLSLTWDNV